LLDFEKQVSPYYNEGHAAFRQHLRSFVEKEILPHNLKWEQEGHIPKEFAKKVVNHGGIHMFPWGLVETQWNGHKWDPFYAIVFAQEMARATGVGSFWIHNMALPPVIYFGKKEVHKQCIKEVMSGDKLIALAISELRGGSDVAQIQTKAELISENNQKYYLINGAKYWITNGMKADYFVTLVRTGEEGYLGLTLLLIPRQSGIFTDPIPLQGSELSETAQVTFKNVKVPIDNVIGEINQGFKPVMYGFNNERFIIASGCIAAARMCVEESIAWAKERQTFGKKLISHQVIRHKIAEMSRLVLASQALLERTAFQLQHDRLGQKDTSIPRNIALLKVQSTRTLQEVVIQASQIFGGRSYVTTGRGAYVDHVYRAVRANAIAGGSEEIMLDFAIRQARL